ncbi:2-oxo-4-hydroxy-4-carboxy-5-ureidoimidazoline decarboxylase [Muricoccus radiodurans]|uniref:2-oxo-4-hydroxy-4-carboxy-5-ureidoimidazoline decarboxylase n=1 Tax=Muricoccus radiodurans TaxID=2231721 RepID=UPI003CF528D7
MALTLEDLNSAGAADFSAALDGVFEHAPWVAARAAAARPFGSVAALHDRLMAVIRAAPEAERLRFLKGHPELTAGPLASDLTAASRAEQGGVALGGLAGAAELDALTAAYRVRHGIPFIICLRRHTAASVLRELRQRLDRDTATEHAAALEEVGHVSRLRLAERVREEATRPQGGN